MADASEWHRTTIRVSFLSEAHALIALNVIEADKERQPDSVKRSLTVEGTELVAIFDTLTVRLARIIVNAYLENVHLVARTLGAFGDDAAASSSS